MNWKVAGIVAAATVGDGVFALPFVFYEAGWLLGIIYLAVLGAMVVLAHTVYFETLKKVGEKERLLGLARKYLGAGGFWTGFAAIVFGLILTLVAYLILGMNFIKLGFPHATPGAPLLFFWAFVAVTVFLNDTYIVELELAGITLTALLIVFVFVSAWPDIWFGGLPAFGAPANFFLPFGAVLFSLAGWTSIEPAYESEKRRAQGAIGAEGAPANTPIRKGVWRSLAMGSLIAAVLYIMFSVGILGTAGAFTPDTISGLANWATWKKDLVAALGLIAVWTVSMPISREIRNSLERDLGWNKLVSRLIIVFLPLLFVLAGLTNFLVIVGLVGGFFLSTQYLLIISVGRRALALPPLKNFFLDLTAAAFIVAAIYEAWTFVVH
jgi:amino acid permease